MCGNIKKLRQPDQVPSDEELRLAALQFVRMVSGYRVPAAVNEAAFNTADWACTGDEKNRNISVMKGSGAKAV